MSFSAEKIDRHICNIRDEYEKLNRSYRKCEWNDRVYESFSRYIDVCKRSVEEAEDVVRSCKQNCQNLNNLDIDSKIEAVKNKATLAKKLAMDAVALCI